MNIKSFCWSLFIVFNISNLSAQNDAYHNTLINQLQTDFGLTGGNWVLNSNESTNASNAISYGHTVTQNPVTGQDFSLAINMNVSAVGNNPWDAGYFIPNVTTIQQGDRVLLVIWMRTVSAALAAPGKVNLFAEHHQTYHKEILLTANPSSQWKQYLIPFESSDTYTAGQLNIGFHTAYQQQVIEFGGVALVNYGTSVALSSLPTKLNNDFYAGSEPNAPWRATAASRIEQHRKANLQLQVLDGSGNPVPNAQVRVEMLRHHYAFGTAVVNRFFPGNSAYNATYQNKLKNLDGNGHGFNWVVMENALKWRAWEQGWAGTTTETVNSLNYLANNNIKVRGHVLVWPGWGNMPDDMQTNSTSPTYLKNRIDGHISSILNNGAISQYIEEWDVINEIAHVRDLEYALQGKAGYPTGREIYPQIFSKALQVDTSLVTYLNDYNILSNGSVTGGDYQLFKSMTQEIISAGSTVDGIGLQAHMGSALVAPDSLYTILEDCYQTFGKDIKITEYDQSDIVPDTTAAKYTGDFLTMIFSHPATNGFLMWGFWDGAHWLANAPLFDMNWNPKPTLTVFNNLVFNEWWTDSTLTTDANGNLTIRGFKGDYRISTTISGTDVIANLALPNDVNTTVQLFPVSTINVLDENDFKAFPNPAQDFIQLEFPSEENWKVTLIDNLGRVLNSYQFSNRQQTLDVSKLVNGIYYLKIEDREGNTVVKKIVVK